MSDAPTSDFVRAVTPSMKEIAAAVSAVGEGRTVAYKYVRTIASSRQEPSAEVRRQFAMWGWEHVRNLLGLLVPLDPSLAEHALRGFITAAESNEAEGEASDGAPSSPPAAG